MTVEHNRDNPAFRSVAAPSAFPDADTLRSDLHRLRLICCPRSFLYDPHSPVHRFYKDRLQEYRAAAARSTPAPAGPAAPPLQAAPPALNHSSVPSSQDAEPVPGKRKRKSRWGSEDDKVSLPMPSIVIPQEVNIPDPNAPSLSGTWQLWISSLTSGHLSVIYLLIIEFCVAVGCSPGAARSWIHQREACWPGGRDGTI